jgi:hypothetical protein
MPVSAGQPGAGPRPAQVCAELLQALEGSEARSRRRKRDQRPDTIGMGMKRALLEAAVQDDPEPDRFEGWLLDRVLSAGHGSGAVRAMALQIFDEWRLAHASPPFLAWLARGAPSEDRDGGGPGSA